MRRRKPALGLGLLAALLATSLGGVRLASAMCAPPDLVVEPTAVASGELLAITGRGFSATCNDQGEGGGCLGGGKPAQDRPAKGIEVQVIQDGRVSTLATVDADKHSRIQVTVRLPGTLHPGPAVVKAGVEVPVEIRP